MLNEIAASVGDVLISNGVKILGDTVKSTTELGLRKVGDLVKDNTGIDIFTEETVHDGLSPEDVLRLKQVEKEYQTDLEKYRLEYAKVITNDIECARKMHETITSSNQSGWFEHNFIYLFAMVWSVFAASYIVGITFFEIPPESQRFADTILGFVLGTIISSIIQFFFGSSFKGVPYTTNTKITNR